MVIVWYIYGIIMFLVIGSIAVKAIVFYKIYGANKQTISRVLSDKLLEKEYKRNKHQKN